MDQFTRALNNAWKEWSVIKDTVPDFAFKDWCRRVHGFEYVRMVGDTSAKLTNINDEKKYVWFLLEWS